MLCLGDDSTESSEVNVETPAYLVAYPYLDHWRQRSPSLRYRHWVLDSGAWGAFNSGKPIDLGRFIADCQQAMLGPNPPREIFALDVIGDWKASLANAITMKEAGVPAIPTYHHGEPVAHLKDLAAAFDKIAIGGVAHQAASFKLSWAIKCFSVVWPKRIHGFSFCERNYVLKCPFDSVDSTAWVMQPIAYSRFRVDGKKKVRFGLTEARTDGRTEKKAGELSLVGEVDYFLRLERQARARWETELRKIGSDGPTLYLALGGFDNPTGYEIGTPEPIRSGTKHPWSPERRAAHTEKLRKSGAKRWAKTKAKGR
jgi:hypothetical protein